MVRVKIGFTALLVAVFASGCASMEATAVNSGAPKTVTGADGVETEMGYITGSRLPRKATQNTQGVTQTRPEDWQRYNRPVAPVQSN